MEQFVKHVKEHGLQTGFFGTQYLLPLLIEASEIKLAYDILFNENYPGWLYQVNHGATTIWERWDAILEDGSFNDKKVTSDNMVSFNHFAFGSVGQFYYQYILGIKALEPGYEKIQIQPYPDARLHDAKGTYQSVKGTISVAWHVKENQFYLDVTVPSEATIILPDHTTHVVLPGSYSYQTILLNKGDK